MVLAVPSFAADPPASAPPAAKTVAISDVDALSIQLQNSHLETLSEQYDKMAAQIQALQSNQAALKNEYAVLQQKRDGEIAVVFKKAGVSQDAYNLDLSHKQLIPKTATPASAPAAVKK
jgi:uncharacterized protein (DUF3084 family)